MEKPVGNTSLSLICLIGDDAVQLSAGFLY